MPGKRTKTRCRWWLALCFLRGRQLPRPCGWWLVLLYSSSVVLANSPTQLPVSQPPLFPLPMLSRCVFTCDCLKSCLSYQ